MISERINYEEFKIFREIPLLIKLRLKKLLDKKVKNKSKVLIIDTCIIGEFLATLPALSLFLKKNKLNTDIIVSPQVKSLAEAIKGIDRVFTAKSIYSRNIEQSDINQSIPKEYNTILVLRISPEAYKLLNNIKYSNIITYDIPFFKYFSHLVKNLPLKKQIKQWREVNFEIVGMKDYIKKIRFNDIFRFSKSDYEQIKKLSQMRRKSKKIIIHTGSVWKMRLWENKKWISLLKKINKLGKFNFIFIGSTDIEKKSFEYIQKNLDFKIFSLINKLDLKETLLLMRMSDYFIGIDSGPRNMAHLADLRSISLLSTGLNNFMPSNKKDIVINKSDAIFTSIFYYPKKNYMQEITTEEVLEAFKKLSKTI